MKIKIQQNHQKIIKMYEKIFFFRNLITDINFAKKIKKKLFFKLKIVENWKKINKF